MPQPAILVAENKLCVQIRLVGRATLACSQSLREFGVRIVERGAPRLLVDLSACESMDSTVMGVLAMIGLRAKKNGIQTEIVNATEHNRSLLCGIGLDRIYTFTRTAGEAEDFAALYQTQCDDPQATGRTMLEAHQTLMDIDPANIPKFQSVVDYLKQDLDRLDGAKTSTN